MQYEGKVWGSTSKLFNKNNVQVNRLVCLAGGRSSMHTHRSKLSMFFVECGKIAVVVQKNDYKLSDRTELTAGQSTIVKPDEYHYFEAIEPSVVYEVYWTELDENDIVRKNCGRIR